MQRNRTLTSSLALAAVIGTGMAAAPFAIDNDVRPLPNAALAQGAGDVGPGVAEERATAKAGSIPDETADSVYETLGTTREEAESADTQTSASSQYGLLDGYQTEVERGNLDAAAESLAAIAEEPITPEVVTEVNTKLGVETTLSAQQIAEAAARKQNGAN
jgi:hypothetical protein